MRIFGIIFIFAITFFLFSCKGPDKTDTPAIPENSAVSSDKSLQWPQGKYLYVNGGGMYFEEWMKGDSGTYKGTAFFINQMSNDTLYTISMNLGQKNDKTTLFYVVKGQNDNKEVEFTLSKEDRNVFVFENPFRDFPSILQYKILGDSAIEVTERGFVNNHEEVKTYTVKKID